jgi:C1A family cysteine protease
LAFLYQYEEIKQNNKSQFQPSRLFIYYNERKIEDHISQDVGASLDDGVKSLNDNGVCDEKLWAYDITKFTVEPTTECYAEGKQCHAIESNVIQKSLFDIKSALVNGFPIAFGFDVFKSFEGPDVAKTGMMPYPKPDEEKLGGHAVAIVGYDDEKESLEGDKGMLIVRNSWSNKWGDQGYFYMPYKYAISANTDDYCVLYKVTDPALIC